MSEVNRFYAGELSSYARVVLDSDFDRVTAERDALQVLLTAAHEREDAARAFVSRLIEIAGGQPSIATGYLSDILDALKPAEGRGDD